MHIILLLHHSWNKQMHLSPEAKPELQALPHLNLYHLPSSKWYFCDRNHSTLRKRRQHTSFGKFVQGHGVVSLMIVLQNEKYIESVITHILKMPQSNQQSTSKQIQCEECAQIIQPIAIFVNQQQFPSISSSKTDHQIVNKLLQAHGVYANEDDQMGIYRFGQSDRVGWIQWNSKGTTFQSDKVSINDHMKKKIIESCALIALKIEEKILSIAEKMNIEELNFPLFKLDAFKLWFVKNSANNQAYLMHVTDIQLKGMGSHCRKLYQLETIQAHTLQKQKQLISQLVSPPQQIISDKSNHFEDKDTALMRMKSIIQRSHQIQGKQPIKEQSKQDKIQQCLCNSCSDLINVTPKLLAMHHIPKIQYLRGVKMIKKIAWNEGYDLVSVCDKCYEFYLQNVFKSKQTTKAIKSNIRPHSLHQKAEVDSQVQVNSNISIKDYRSLKVDFQERMRAQLQISIPIKNPKNAVHSFHKQQSCLRTTTNHSSAKSMNQNTQILIEGKLRISTEQQQISTQKDIDKDHANKYKTIKSLCRDRSIQQKPIYQKISHTHKIANIPILQPANTHTHFNKKHIHNEPHHQYPTTIREELESKGATPNHKIPLYPLQANLSDNVRLSHKIDGAISEYQSCRHQRRVNKVKSYINRKWLINPMTATMNQSKEDI